MVQTPKNDHNPVSFKCALFLSKIMKLWFRCKTCSPLSRWKSASCKEYPRLSDQVATSLNLSQASRLRPSTLLRCCLCWQSVYPEAQPRSPGKAFRGKCLCVDRCFDCPVFWASFLLGFPVSHVICVSRNCQQIFSSLSACSIPCLQSLSYRNELIPHIASFWACVWCSN